MFVCIAYVPSNSQTDSNKWSKVTRYFSSEKCENYRDHYLVKVDFLIVVLVREGVLKLRKFTNSTYFRVLESLSLNLLCKMYIM